MGVVSILLVAGLTSLVDLAGNIFVFTCRLVGLRIVLQTSLDHQIFSALNFTTMIKSFIHRAKLAKLRTSFLGPLKLFVDFDLRYVVGRDFKGVSLTNLGNRLVAWDRGDILAAQLGILFVNH